MENEFQLHLATLDDIPTLVIHRRLMFEEMYHLENDVIDKADLDEVDKAYANYLQRSLLCGIAWSWVIRHMDEIPASCVISLIDYPPNPGNPTGQMALLHGVYTESAYRRLGLARCICNEAVNFCQKRGISRITLNASKAGRSLYESLGFESVTTQMRLTL